MGGKSSRVKGHSFERDIAKDFKELGYKDARRLLEYQEGMGVDLENTGKFRVQCKRYKDYCPISKINEVPKEKNTIPLLITKGDRKETMVVMSWNDHKSILSQLDRAINEKDGHRADLREANKMNHEYEC